MCSCAAGSRDRRSCGVPVVHGDQSKPWNRPRQISYFSSISATASAWSSAVLPVPPALRVGRQRLLQLVGQAEVVDHQPAGLVLEDAVHARDGLHQPVPAHRLVHVHRVQARRVEAGQPHVAHDHDLERVCRVAEARGQVFAPRLVADVRLPVERVGRRAGHHDLERALLVVVADATPAARRTSSRYSSTQMRRLMHTTIALPSIAASRFSKCSTRSRAMSLMRFSEPTTASSCAHRLLSFSLRSTSSPSVASSNSGSIFGRLGFLQLQLGQPALVVDRHRGAVDDGALDVVDADVVAEHGARVGVGLLDRRAGEADERGVGQRVAHVPREAVDEVVLAAVRLVGDDDDVAPVREHRMPVASLLGEELLDGREHHAAGGDGELRAQIGAVGGLHRRLAQQVAAAREGAEELVVEVVAVGEHDDRRVLHRRVQDHAAGIEGHRQALARALRVPDDADAPVALLRRRAAGRPS